MMYALRRKSESLEAKQTYCHKANYYQQIFSNTQLSLTATNTTQ